MNLGSIVLVLLAAGIVALIAYYFMRGRPRHADTAPAPLTADFALDPDQSWGSIAKADQLDPALRRIVSLMENADHKQGWDEVYRRTGIKNPKFGGSSASTPELPLLIELNPGATLPAVLTSAIPQAYANEIRRNTNLTHVTARLALDKNEIFDGKKSKVELRKSIDATLKAVKRVSLAAPLQPCFEDTLSDIGIPADNAPRDYTRNGTTYNLDGNGVVIGIIDDGCAFAHPDFRNGNATRVKHLWHQGMITATAPWSVPTDFGYGAQIDDTQMNAAITSAGNVEDVYANLGYEMPLGSHGTHVMGIAAANPGSLIPAEGVAPAADIIFVQLPVAAIESGGAALYNHILDGVLYIFSRAKLLGNGEPAVINISYGGYAGPHDGTTELERGIDQLLDSTDATDRVSRSVVIAAGNGFEADCHAAGTIDTSNPTKELHWNLKPEDPTSNTLEIWYNGDARLTVKVTPPGATQPLGPVTFKQRRHIVRNVTGVSKPLIGSIDHVEYSGKSATPDKRITIILGPTAADPTLPTLVPVPSGVWTITLEQASGSSTAARFHAWIERDASGGRGSARRQQSHFMPENSTATVCAPDPRYTLGSIATGDKTVVVGAYNSAAHELSRYTACGPTRDGRDKPEICAPAEGDAASRGVLSTSSLRAQPTRMNGTSAAAPHVAGALALMYDYINKSSSAGLSAVDMRQKIMDGAVAIDNTWLNRHQQADARRENRRQSDVGGLDKLTKKGKLNIKGALDQIP